jgi:SAM-dependent methyltransferase
MFHFALPLVLVLPAALLADEIKSPTKILYVPTPEAVVEKMLEFANVKKGDVVFDLGCGDGRVVAMAAKKFGVKGVGVDIDPARIEDSKATLKKYDVEKLVEIRKGDALKVPDLGDASVVTLYMLPDFMELWEPIAKKALKPGTRIISHDFRFISWKPDKELEVEGPDRMHTLYMWIVKKKD